MRIIACIICFTILTFPSHAQGYYEEGTRWTELKLDTLRYESWFTEVNDGVTTKYIPNYERTDFYIKGDTTKLNSTRMKVWRHIEGIPDSVAYFIEKLDRPHIMLSSPYFLSYGNISASCFAYNFQWEAGKELRSFRLPNSQSTSARNPYIYGSIEEIKTGTFGTNLPLEYVELNNHTIIKGIGVTSWQGRDCIFGPTEAWYMEWMCNSNVANDYRSILVHFEQGGKVLYDMWPNEKGELTTSIHSTTENVQNQNITYDLQGRKTARKPSRGIYISGGKKRVAK